MDKSSIDTLQLSSTPRKGLNSLTQNKSPMLPTLAEAMIDSLNLKHLQNEFKECTNVQVNYDSFQPVVSSSSNDNSENLMQHTATTINFSTETRSSPTN